MTIPLQPLRRRRFVLLCAATVVLHYLALVSVPSGSEAPERAPVPVVVELRPPVPVVVELRPPAPIKALVEPGAAVPERQVQSVNNTPAKARRPVSRAGYLADLPPSAQLGYSLVRAGSSGPAASGETRLAWMRGPASYRLQVESTMAGAPPGELVAMDSEGEIGRAGIVPRSMTDKRRGRARTATHFDGQGKITFSASERAVPAQPGAQDKATWPMQLAGIARAASGQLDAGLQIQVGESRDARVYRFVVLGREEIVTGMGVLATWRLARLAAPDSYDARLEVWLAPEYQWYPVQLRSTENNGTVTTQTIRSIVVDNAGK